MKGQAEHDTERLDEYIAAGKAYCLVEASPFDWVTVGILGYQISFPKDQVKNLLISRIGILAATMIVREAP